MNKVGNLLKEKREEKNLSIDDISRSLKIEKPYLEAIENGNYAFFKNHGFYQQVFVSSYANFLGLDKNEILKDLIDDNKQALAQIKDQPQTNEQSNEKSEEAGKQAIISHDDKLESDDVPAAAAVEVSENIVSQPNVDTKDVKADAIQEVESIAVEQPKEENLETTRPLNSFLEGLRQASRNSNENLLADKGLPKKAEEVEKIEDEKDNEISQILNNLKNNHVNPLQQTQEDKADVEVVSNNEEKTDEKIVSNNLNASLRDQINKLNESDVQSDDLSQEDVSVPKYEKDSSLESTAVIDLTSGIELEKIPAELKNDFNQDVNEIREEDAAGEKVADKMFGLDANDEKVVGLKDLEKNINSAKDMDLINEDPDKTSMNLKIAKALGDSKMVLDEATSKKIKRERLVNGILIALIIILIIVLIYQLVLSK